MIVAPSGAGKSSLVDALLQNDPGLKLSLSTTTRAPRPGEVEGKNYRFVSKTEFLHAHEADYIVVNDSFDQALVDLKHILAASRLRSGPAMARNPALLKRLGV